MGISPQHRRSVLTIGGASPLRAPRGRRSRDLDAPLRSAGSLARLARLVIAAALAVAGPATTNAAVVRTVSQVELDGIVSRVGTRIITRSDVRQARLLKLVDDTSSDDAIRRALENRTLLLSELGRGTPLPPVSDADLALRRREWQATLGGERVEDLLARVAMGDADLQSWLRDDLRIRAYLARQFSATPEGERPRATAELIARLRTRAGLD